MATILTLLGSSWHWIAALAAVVAALFASYFGGKKIGKVQTQAAADVEAEKVKSAEVVTAANVRVQTTKAAQNVSESVNDMSGSDVDKRLLDKWTKD